MTRKPPWFARAVVYTNHHFAWLHPPKKKGLEPLSSDDLQRDLIFSGLDLEPYDIILFSQAAALLAFLACLTACILLVILSISYLHFLEPWMVILMGLCLITVPVAILNLCTRYPRSYARTMRIRSLGDVPEILSYLVMSLKLVPNLETSVKFAAQESKTALAADLRKLLWDTEIRVYHGIDEALAVFSAYWGQWHEYLKRSLHLLRSSVCEHDEVSRALTLDRALDVSLEGTKETMNRFVNALHQPTMILYSIGVMIPLSLVAMLPAVGLIGLRLSLLHVFLLYDIVIPLIVYLYMMKIMRSRPAAFSPPDIEPDHPGLSGVSKRREATVAIGIAGLLASPFLLSLLHVPMVSPALTQMSMYFPLSVCVIWAVAGAVSWYCLRVYTPYKKVWDGIKAMEREFSDALFVLGRRLAEGRSPEESILFTAKAVAGTRIAEVFRQTGYLQRSMSISLSDAFFHPEFGSLRHVPSDRIKAITRLIVEGMTKSQQAVSLSMIRIADHLRELQEVEGKIKDMLNELVSTLRATATVFAPMIAGVTLSITWLISSILGSAGAMLSAVPEDASGLMSVSSAFSAPAISPEWFVLVIGVYLVELVVLLTRFANGISDGDDHALYMYSLGRTMVVAVVVFSGTVVAGQVFFRQLVPSV